MFKTQINNFRSFDHETFSFSRINILIGENSGGKSSLLKFFLALKQTLELPFESNLKLRGDLTDLGNYKEVIRNKDEKKNLEFGFSSNEDYLNYFINFYNSIVGKQEPEEVFSITDLLNSLSPDDETSINFILSSSLNNHQSIKTTISNKKIGKISIKSRKTETLDNGRDLTSLIKFDFGNAKGVIENCSSFKEGFFTLFGFELRKKY